MTRLGFFDVRRRLPHNGNGTFSNVPRERPASRLGAGFTAGWVYFDLDGHLDLFIPSTSAECFTEASATTVSNNGNGTF